jgi:hypothetical protein
MRAGKTQAAPTVTGKGQSDSKSAAFLMGHGRKVARGGRGSLNAKMGRNNYKLVRSPASVGFTGFFFFWDENRVSGRVVGLAPVAPGVVDAFLRRGDLWVAVQESICAKRFGAGEEKKGCDRTGVAWCCLVRLGMRSTDAKAMLMAKLLPWFRSVNKVCPSVHQARMADSAGQYVRRAADVQGQRGGLCFRGFGQIFFGRPKRPR